MQTVKLLYMRLYTRFSLRKRPHESWFWIPHVPFPTLCRPTPLLVYHTQRFSLRSHSRHDRVGLPHVTSFRCCCALLPDDIERPDLPNAKRVVLCSVVMVDLGTFEIESSIVETMELGSAVKIRHKLVTSACGSTDIEIQSSQPVPRSVPL